MHIICLSFMRVKAITANGVGQISISKSDSVYISYYIWIKRKKRKILFLSEKLFSISLTTFKKLEKGTSLPP